MARSGGNTAVAPLVAATAPTAAELASASGAAGIGALTAEMIRRSLSRAIAAARSVSLVRTTGLAAYVEEAYREREPNATRQAVQRAVRLEREREATFRARQVARMRRTLGRALREADPGRRVRRVQAVLDAERRYGLMREEAVAARAAGRADATVLQSRSPEGVVWKLGPREHHTLDCVAMANKAWPWDALWSEDMIPPVHAGCGCGLQSIAAFAVLHGYRPKVPDVGAAVVAIRAAKALAHDEMGRHRGA